MKRKDWALIAVVVFISGIFSLVASNYFINTPENRQQEVEVVKAISPEFNKPDKRYFNNDSFDPTQQITIGDNANPNPFNSTPQ